MIKTFVVGGNTNYVNFISDIELVDDVKDAKLVVFTGGEDVDPSIYNCEKHYRTCSNLKRDLEEKKIFDSLDPNKQVCLGICRGSQFLCCMNGGILVQDCNGHAIWSTHCISNGIVAYEITSTHHQMQYPFTINPADYTILFQTWPLRSSYYEGDKLNTSTIRDLGEPEIVSYHVDNKPKCLAVQGHPEMIPDSPVAEMIDNLIKDLVK